MPVLLPRNFLNIVIITGLRFDISRHASGADTLDAAGSDHCTQHGLYGRGTDIRENLADFGFGNRGQTVQNGCLDAGFLGDFLSMYHSKTLVQLFVAHIKRGQKILNKREVGVFVAFPANRGLAQGFVIVGFVVVDLLFKGNILTSIEAILVKQQQRKQARHSSVAIRRYHIETPQENDS